MKKLIWLAVIVSVLLCSCPPPPPPGPPIPPGPPRRPPRPPKPQTPGVSIEGETILVELPEEAAEESSSAYMVVLSDR